MGVDQQLPVGELALEPRVDLPGQPMAITVALGRRHEHQLILGPGIRRPHRAP